MIFLTFGTDKIKCLDKHNALVKALVAKNPVASVFKVGGDNFIPEQFEELIAGQTLFAQKYIVGCDNLLLNKEANKFLLDKLDKIATSENIFIFVETEEMLSPSASKEEKGKCDKRRREIEKIKKLARRAQEFVSRGAKEEFNLFSIVDAFSARDRKTAWTLYQEALLAGVAPEQILWKLIWQTDNMLIVMQTKKEKTIKMKPFVLEKTRRAAKKFTLEELKAMSAAFIDLYHSEYLGTDDFEFGLEKIILSI